MKIKIEALKDSQKLLRIEIERDKVDIVLGDVYNEIQKTAKVAGFRTGKAPRDIIEARYNKTANEEALNRLVWDSYREAVIEKNIDVVGYPVIEDVKFEDGKPLTFCAKVEVRPEFQLKNYKGIKVKEKTCEVTDEDIDNALKNLQESLAQYKNVEGRAISMGDYIVCEYESFEGAKSIDKNNKLWLYINEKFEPRELLDAIVGTAKDVTKEVEVSYPPDHQNKDLAGKKILYKVTPREIKEKHPPEINDELAKEAGRFKDLAELKEHLRQNILKTKQAQSQRDLENQISQDLLKNHLFDIPKSVVERQSEHLMEDAKLKLLYQGYKREDLDKQDKQLKEALKPNAENNVRLFFIFDQIAQQEHIKVEEKELDEKIEQMAKSYKEEPKDVRKRLEEHHLLDNLKEQILHDKVFDFLLNEAIKKGEI